MAKQFITTLSDITYQCLRSDSLSKKNSNSKDNNKNNNNSSGDEMMTFKQRSYQWFKMFLLNSNVWLCKSKFQNSKENKNNDIMKSILFQHAIDVTNEQLKAQKEYIWTNVKQEEKNDNKVFNQVVTFGNKTDSKDNDVSDNNNNNNNNKVVLRQDAIENGITSINNEFEIIVASVSMDQTSKDFDVEFENNTKIYLTQCLTFAHVNNPRFQSSMKNILVKIFKMENINLHL